METVPFFVDEYLDTPDSQAELLADAFETGDAGYIAQALGTVARARGMTQIARDAGVSREALYRVLREGGDPKLTTFLGVLKALGLRVEVSREPKGEAA